jgi:hypothetical protein
MNIQLASVSPKTMSVPEAGRRYFDLGVGGNQQREIPMANPILLKEPTKVDNKERSEAVSENSNVPTINGGNLPVQLDHDIDVLLQETARSNPIMRWKNETDYRIGEDERELGREYRAFYREWSRGPVKWLDGEIVKHHIKRVVDDPTLPSRESLGDNDSAGWKDQDKDPWSFMNYLPMEDVETGEFVLFSTSSIGGKIAIEKLCNEVAREIKAGCKSGEPIVRLARGTFKTRFGEIKPRPDFPINGWVDQEPIEKDLNDADTGDDVIVYTFSPADDVMACKRYVRERCGIQFRPTVDVRPKTSQSFCTTLLHLNEGSRERNPSPSTIILMRTGSFSTKYAAMSRNASATASRTVMAAGFIKD